MAERPLHREPARACGVRDMWVRGSTMSTPRDNQDSEAEHQGDGLRDEIEEILREQGEKPVMPRPPRARDGGPRSTAWPGCSAVLAPEVATDFELRPAMGTFMRAALLLFLTAPGRRAGLRLHRRTHSRASRHPAFYRHRDGRSRHHYPPLHDRAQALQSITHPFDGTIEAT